MSKQLDKKDMREPDIEKIRFFLMRHGETDWNKTFRYQGCTDVELNDEGTRQARRLALRLSSIRPARIVASPLVRALRTAQIASEMSACETEIEVLDDLREISFGFWEGLTSAELEERDPDTYASWKRYPFSLTPRGGEPIEEVALRSRCLAGYLLGTTEPGGTVFIFSHGAILRSLLSVMMKIDDLNIVWRMRMDNCSITIVDMWGSRPSLTTLNDTLHMRLGDAEILNLKFAP